MHIQRPTALLVGAYERDNFGDILFLLLTEKYLKGASVTAASPIHADMSAVFGRYVQAYGPLLKTRRWDSVWSVGGEIGRVSYPTALKYSLGSDMGKVYREQDNSGRRAIRRALGSDIDQDLVYVPTMREYPLNSGANLVINSAGLGAMGALETNIQKRYLRKLRAAKVINVRDQKSSDYLSSHGIEHSLTPDLVHTISRVYPANDVQSGSYLCVHAAASYLKAVGNDLFASRVADLAAATGLDIKLFLAGTAEGHDSAEAYREIANQAATREPNYSFDVTESRHPLDLVEVIRQSKGWVGTSLHGRIVAESYGVPRVSLSKASKKANPREKTAVYAATWDGHMPFAVTLDEIVSATKAALKTQQDRGGYGTGALVAQSHASMLRTVSKSAQLAPIHQFRLNALRKRT